MLLFQNGFDLRINNSAKCIQTLLGRCNVIMLGEPEAKQVLQVKTDLGCHKRTCRDKEILTEHRLTPLQIPVGMLQLILVKIREQTPVIIEYRTHGNWVHRFRIKQNTEIAVMTVGIENQGIQNAHPSEIIYAAKFLEVIQKNRIVRSPWKMPAAFARPWSSEVNRRHLLISLPR